MSTATMGRTLRLSDLMIALAATAAGLSLVRYDLATPISLRPMVERGAYRFEPGYRALDGERLLTLGSLLLAAWSPALFWAGLRGHAPRWKASLQPGPLACAVASLVAAIYLGRSAGEALVWGWPLFEIPAPSIDGRTTIVGVLDRFPMGFFPRLRGQVGPAVAFAWALLALCGRWRRPIGWADWSGVIAGVAWLLLCLETLL